VARFATAPVVPASTVTSKTTVAVAPMGLVPYLVGRSWAKFVLATVSATVVLQLGIHRGRGICTADLLVVRDDSRFDAGRPPLVYNQAAHGTVEEAKFLAETVPFEIMANNPQRDSDSAKAPDIRGYIGRSSKAGTFRPYLHDRNRGFGADAGDRTPDKSVQHQVAKNQDALIPEIPNGFNQNVRITGVPV